MHCAVRYAEDVPLKGRHRRLSSRLRDSADRHPKAESPDAAKEKTMYRPTHLGGPGIGRGQDHGMAFQSCLRSFRRRPQTTKESG